MLYKAAHYNDLSEGLRKELEKRISTFGNIVRYKFDISRENPDPEKRNGKIIWPFQYTLGPSVFTIVDKYETDPKKDKRKTIGIVKSIDSKKGIPNSFERIRVKEQNKGILELRTEDPDDLEKIAFLELHPKNRDGMFSNPNVHRVFTRIDEKKFNEQKREERNAKVKALNFAMSMSEADVKKFADAMLWDSTQETEILKGMIEEMAENSPQFFNDLVNGKNIEYQATIKRALDKRIIAFDPAAYKYTWCANNQPIAVLQPTDDKNEVQKFAEFLQLQQSDEVFKKIKSLLGDKS